MSYGGIAQVVEHLLSKYKVLRSIPLHLNKMFIKKVKEGQVPVAHNCNPRYSGGRDRDDYNSRPAWAKKVQKTPSQSIAGYDGMCLSSQLHRRLRLGRLWFQAIQGKKVQKTPSNRKSWT
jgi:hypothetical protein